MRGPLDAETEQDAAREAKEESRRRYPAGKALGRIEYFETQRGLPRTDVVDGLVTRGPLKAKGIVKKPPARRAAAKPSGYAKANKAKAALVPAFTAAVHLPVWQALGPRLIPKGQTYGSGGNNKPAVSGRCVGIMISPTNANHLVLCTAGGGLWGTLDQGATWRPLTDGQPTLAMGAIAHAPSSPNIVYAGTGEGDTFSQLGVGLLRSSDGGQTWQHVPSNDLSGTGVYDIAVDPANPLHVWVGTFEKLLESTDGGATWRTVQPVRTWDVSINPVNPQEIFVATEAGLIRSANGGAAWSLVPLAGSTATSRFQRMEVCHAPSNPAIVYVGAVLNGRGLLWRRSTNGGAFSAETPPAFQPKSDIAQSWYDWCMAVSPADPQVVYWGAVELYKGTRAASGWNWQDIASRASGDSIHPDQHHLAFDPSHPNVLYACNDGGVFRSPDGGATWKSLNPGLSITEFEFLGTLESQDDWLIGGTQDNGTLGNASNGVFNQIALGDGGDCGADDASQLCYHSYYGMAIERAAATGGNAFQWVGVLPSFPANYPALFYPPMDVSASTVAKAGATLLVSEDSGGNWAQVPFGSGTDKASALTIADASTIFIGTESGNLFRIDRAAAGWTGANVTALVSPRNGFISDIVPLKGHKSTVWVSSSAFGKGHVFRSTNGGKTWSDRSGNLPDIPVNAIVVDPTNVKRVFAATDHGVYRTQTSGGKWIDFSNGLPNVVVGDLILHERNRLLYAGTHNRGAWQVKV
jgi:photosystem II stability/assembly factor-like uncharacterized protein